MSRADLIRTYIDGLNLAEVTVVCSGRQCRICIGEPADGEKVKASYHLKPTHADLVLATIGKEGVTGTKPAVLAASIEKAAATLGANYFTLDALRAEAAVQVAEITARIKAAGLSGALKQWNTRYRQYRLARAEQGEPAIPYSVFLEQVVIMPTVRDAAASGLIIQRKEGCEPLPAICH